MRKRLALSLFFFLLAAMPYAHTQSTTGDSTQSQNTDCSDPMNAMSAGCGSDLSQQGQYGLGNYGQAGNYGQTGERNVPTGAPFNTRTYTDLGNTTNPTANGNRNLQPSTVPAPPEPLTEFQKFVAGTTGQVLPIFGASLFRNVPSTFAPVEQIPVTPDYIVGPDDELRIRVWGQVNFNADVRVDRSGSVLFCHRWARLTSPGCLFRPSINTCAQRLAASTAILILLSTLDSFALSRYLSWVTRAVPAPTLSAR